MHSYPAPTLLKPCFARFVAHAFGVGFEYLSLRKTPENSNSEIPSPTHRKLVWMKIHVATFHKNTSFLKCNPLFLLKIDPSSLHFSDTTTVRTPSHSRRVAAVKHSRH